ncbi:UNVERIFIED_CONTAM: hypothetical protein FKN15_037491 [Acipenser sinensis]
MTQEFKNNKIRQGDPPLFLEKGPLLATSFKDARTVTLLSIVHDTSVISKRIRSKGPEGFRVI